MTRVLALLAMLVIGGVLSALGYSLRSAPPPPDHGAVAPSVYHVAGVCE